MLKYTKVKQRKHGVDVHSIQGAIWRISYFAKAKAKARRKGYKPDQTKNYGKGRIKQA